MTTPGELHAIADDLERQAKALRALAVAPPSPLIGPDEALAFLGNAISRRRLLESTARMPFRKDKSQKQPLFERTGFEQWALKRTRTVAA